MTLRLDEALLDRVCGVCRDSVQSHVAARAVEALDWLAPWWLEAEVLERAADHRGAYKRYLRPPELPRDPGCCWVLCTNPRGLALMRSAYVLPLQWRPSSADDACLPPSFRRMADLLREQFRSPDSWGLFLAAPKGAQAVDLSRLGDKAADASSGWAALATGLLLGRDGIVPDAKVWATAAWDETYGIGKVDGLPAKLNRAKTLGATHVFVPAQNQEEATSWQQENGVTIGLLSPPRGRPKPAHLLEPYLDRVSVPPASDDAFEKRRAYYARVSRERSNEYHWSHLLKDAVQKCRSRLTLDHPDCQPSHLVTVVSYQPPVVVQAPASLGVETCLLLYDANDERIPKHRDAVLAFLKAKPYCIDCLPVPIKLGSRPDELRQLREIMGDFLVGVSVERVAFDLTPGFRSLILELQELAPRGSWLLSCRHAVLEPDNRVDPGTERYDCWRKG